MLAKEFSTDAALCSLKCGEAVTHYFVGCVFRSASQ
jgi:hypothetical protein